MYKVKELKKTDNIPCANPKIKSIDGQWIYDTVERICKSANMQVPKIMYSDVKVPKESILGEVHKGFEVANKWLGATRLQVGATCLGRAERAFNHAIEWAATRQQFGQPIGKFQGTSFKLSDMAMELKAAQLLILEAGWKYDQGTATDLDMAMAKLKASEMLAMVSDEAIQIHGGMGLMTELPLERIWRDARLERIWEGTSEIQRHIISRSLLRPYEN